MAQEVAKMTTHELDDCLQQFLPSVRKCDGSAYPPRSLKEMTAAIQHFFNYQLKRDFSIWNHPDFHHTRLVLDGKMKQLAREGMVKTPRRAEVISTDMESQLWHSGVLGDGSPRQLLETMVFVLGEKNMDDFVVFVFKTFACLCVQVCIWGYEPAKSIETWNLEITRNWCYVRKTAQNNWSIQNGHPRISSTGSSIAEWNQNTSSYCQMRWILNGALRSRR